MSKAWRYNGVIPNGEDCVHLFYPECLHLIGFIIILQGQIPFYCNSLLSPVAMALSAHCNARQARQDLHERF